MSTELSRGLDGPGQPTTSGDDLAWDAFRYVADAMGPLEVATFEDRLLEDQAAREAVATAAEQFGALVLVAREVEADRPRVVALPARRGRVPAFAAAAAALLLTTWWAVGSRPQFEPTAGDDVSRAWAQLRRNAAPVEGTLPFLADWKPTPSTPDAVGAEGDAAEVIEVRPEQPLPSWMLAAVAPAVPSDASAPEGR